MPDKNNLFKMCKRIDYNDKGKIGDYQQFHIGIHALDVDLMCKGNDYSKCQ